MSQAPNPALDPEVAQRVAGLMLRARRAADGALSGLHRSPQHGTSAVFAEHRPYRPGDDLRLLDWRAYARTDRHSVKRFDQEAHLRVRLVLDRSASMHWTGPSGGSTKLEHAATLLAGLAYVLFRQGDAVGLSVIDEELRNHLATRARPAHLQALLDELIQPAVQGSATRLASTLEAVGERIGRRGVLVLASDLLDDDPNALQPLAHLVTRGHDVIVLHVLHPDELVLPFEEGAVVEGLEGEPSIESDGREVKEAYQAEIARFLEDSRKRCLSIGARYALCRSDEAPERTLASILGAAAKKGWH